MPGAGADARAIAERYRHGQRDRDGCAAAVAAHRCGHRAAGRWLPMAARVSATPATGASGRDRPRAHVGEQLLHHIGADRVVRGEEAAAEVQAEGLAAVEIDDDGTGIAAQRRAVVQEARLLDPRHAAGREPLLVVDLAVDLLHQVRFGNAAVIGRIADGRDILGHRRSASPARSASRASRSPAIISTSKNATSGPGSSSMCSGLTSLKTSLLGLSISWRKSTSALIGRRGPPGSQKPVALARRELVRDVAVGHQDVVGDQPAGADPVELARPCSSMRPTARIALSSKGLALFRRAVQISLSAWSTKTSLASLFLIARTGRVRRRTMLSNATLSSGGSDRLDPVAAFRKAPP